jgi:hypothetical protein
MMEKKIEEDEISRFKEPSLVFHLRKSEERERKMIVQT